MQQNQLPGVLFLSAFTPKFVARRIFDVSAIVVPVSICAKGRGRLEL
jgi:hypothetical protein